MAWRLVKQPNGLYARFSSVVDHFTHYDLDEQEAFSLCSALAGQLIAREKIENADNKPGRFKEAISIIWGIHGKREAMKTKRELSKPRD